MNSSIYDLLLKYPRTPHLQGSRLQDGDEDLAQLRYADMRGQYVVFEEKLDGANTGISFSPAGDLLLQSRGHYLEGGGRERQFNLFKAWATAHEGRFLERLEDRYVVYGEWLYKKHSVFYDRLPHYFCEFDVFDRQREVFLSTAARRVLLQGLPILSVPVLFEGLAPASLKELLGYIRPSLAKSRSWTTAMTDVVTREGFDINSEWEHTDKSDFAEGGYGKIEEGGLTTGRFKWVRQGFVQAIVEGGKHHSELPLVPNQLAQGVDNFAPALTVSWEDLKGEWDDTYQSAETRKRRPAR